MRMQSQRSQLYTLGCCWTYIQHGFTTMSSSSPIPLISIRRISIGCCFQNYADEIIQNLTYKSEFRRGFQSNALRAPVWLLGQEWARNQHLISHKNHSPASQRCWSCNA